MSLLKGKKLTTVKPTARIRFAKSHLGKPTTDITVSPDATLMDSLLQLGLPVASSCRGEGVCTKCRLHVRELEPDATTPVTAFEQGLLDRIGADPDERISCQTHVRGLIEVDANYW